MLSVLLLSISDLQLKEDSSALLSRPVEHFSLLVELEVQSKSLDCRDWDLMLRVLLLLEEVEQERRRKQRVGNKRVGRLQEVLHLLVKLAKYLRISKHKLMASRHWLSLLRHSLSLPQEVWMAVLPSLIQHTDSQSEGILKKHMKNTPW
jgi:hypothetical protein